MIFGPSYDDEHHCFWTFDLVNLTFVHVLVCPRREVKRFVDLSVDETSDLWITAKKVGGCLESYLKASSLTFTIQDGPDAGQTVPHVHIHILPRKKGDFEKNDEIYDELDMKEKELKHKLDLDKERKDRTVEEMTQEADEYRMLFSEHVCSWENIFRSMQSVSFLIISYNVKQKWNVIMLGSNETTGSRLPRFNFCSLDSLE